MDEIFSLSKWNSVSCYLSPPLFVDSVVWVMSGTSSNPLWPTPAIIAQSAQPRQQLFLHCVSVGQGCARASDVTFPPWPPFDQTTKRSLRNQPALGISLKTNRNSLDARRGSYRIHTKTCHIFLSLLFQTLRSVAQTRSNQGIRRQFGSPLKRHLIFGSGNTSQKKWVFQTRVPIGFDEMWQDFTHIL